MKISLSTIGIVAPGIESWQNAGEIFCGVKKYEKTAVVESSTNSLPSNERRRTTELINLALQVAEQAMQQSQISPQQVYTVFASSEGDTYILDKICSALTLPDKPVSPTQFHNSVHNAAAGYWAIATHSQSLSTSLSAGKHTFPAGLLEAASLAITEQHTVLLVCYDNPAPPPLKTIVGIDEPFGCALLLNPNPSKPSLTNLTIDITQGAKESNLQNYGLEKLRNSNPAARSLPLLQAVAENKPNTVVLDYLPPYQLKIRCEPC